MSLDVYLMNKMEHDDAGLLRMRLDRIKDICDVNLDPKMLSQEGSDIYWESVLRQILELTSQESTQESAEEVYSANITHNLNDMAAAAEIYIELWRPEELGITRAGDLVPRLTQGLEKLKSNPEYFKRFNPSNGWGSYEGLVEFVETYLEACKKYPFAAIRVSR